MKKSFKGKIDIRAIAFCMVFLLAPAPMADAAWRVVLMETMPVPSVLEHSKYFRIRLKELGYTEGGNLDLTILKPDGDRELAGRLLKNELEKNTPDLVVTIATLASTTALELLGGGDVPILFFQVSDPVGAGLIPRIGAPTGSNITGKVYTVSREAKMEMALRLVGRTSASRPIRFGYIHTTYQSSVGDIRELMKIGETNGDFTFVPHEIRYRTVPEGLPAMIEETKKAIETLKGKVDFWIEPMGPLGETMEYTKTLLEHSDAPIAIGAKFGSVEMGALMHISPDLASSAREAAMIADKILKGADPGEIPVTTPMEFDLGFNLTTAIDLGVVIPPDMLQLAGKNVYR